MYDRIGYAEKLEAIGFTDILTRARELAIGAGAHAVGCGHAGDGNLHDGIFCPDVDIRKKLLSEIVALAMELGGAISGEHGLGRAKTSYF
jgi:glycolate oxidase